MKTQILIVVVCAVVVAAKKTPCQFQRELALTVSDYERPRPGTFIPHCAPDGTYAPKQCHGSTGLCWCVTEDGNQINESARGKYEACECIRHKHIAEKQGLIGSYRPQCQENGRYTKNQCWGSVGTCWCADEKTGEKVSDNSSDC